MKAAKGTLGILFSVAVAAAGLVVGIWWGWVGGIETLVRGAQATPVNGGDIAWGLVRSLVLGDLIISVGFIVAFLTGTLTSLAAWGKK